MLTIPEVAAGLTGALRLARMDAGGLALLDATPAGALRSFRVALLVLPLQAVMRLLLLWPDLDRQPLADVLTAELLIYVLVWTAFPVAMIEITRALGREALYPLYVSANNWANLVASLVYFPAVLLVAAGLMPQELIGLINIAAIIYAWFIFRSSLQVSGIAAAALVLADLSLFILINDMVRGRLLGL